MSYVPPGPALVESALTSAQADILLSDVLGDLTVVRRTSTPASVTEQRDGARYTLGSTPLTWVGRATRT